MRNIHKVIIASAVAGVAVSGIYVVVSHKNQSQGLSVYGRPTQADMQHRQYSLVFSNDAIVGSSNMQVPLGVPVKIAISSTKDQSSSDISIPDLQLSAQAQTGSVSSFDFTPNRTGTFDIVITRREAEPTKIHKTIGKLIVQ